MKKLALLLVTLLSTLPSLAGSITGPNYICYGTTITLHDSMSGGTWSSSNDSVVTVNSSGVVSLGTNAAYTAGVAIISYTVGSAVDTLTISAHISKNMPTAGYFCSSSDRYFTYIDTTPGGTWSFWTASSTSVLIDTTGDTLNMTVYSESSGGLEIQFNYNDALCSIPLINYYYSAAEVPFYGAWLTSDTWFDSVVLRAGDSSTLFGNPNPSEWSSDYPDLGYPLIVGTNFWASWSPTTSAIFNLPRTYPDDGGAWLVGVTPGYGSITYTATNGCGAPVSATWPVRILPAFDISGPTCSSGSSTICVCDSQSVVLTVPTDFTGGTWSTSNPGTVTISGYPDDTSATITGLLPGYDTITYTSGSYSSYVIVQVQPYPVVGVITGSTTVITCSTTALSDTSSGGAWTSGTTSIATIDGSGNVTGVSPGSVLIHYTVTNSCGTSTVTDSITVTPFYIAPITGGSTFCQGSTVTLNDTTIGGSWSISGDGTSATIIASGTMGATVTDLSDGDFIASYTVSNSCGTVAVYDSLHFVPTIITDDMIGPIYRYPGITSAGTSTYVNLGDSSVMGFSVYADSRPKGDGTWNMYFTSSNTSVITLSEGTASTNNKMSGVGIGSSDIIMTVYSICADTIHDDFTVTVRGPLSISGPTCSTDTTHICICNAQTVNLTIPSTYEYGSWSTSDGSTVSITAYLNDSTVSITGIAPGTASITYTADDGSTSTIPVNVSANPVAGTISGSDTICTGMATTYSSSGDSGTWVMASTISTMTASGTSTSVTASAIGTFTLYYLVTNRCTTDTATKNITVLNIPALSISGINHVCTDNSITLSGTPSGGTWSVSNSNANINSSGLLSGVSPGADTAIYTLTNYCGSVSSTYNVAVNPSADAGIISGASTVCSGSSTTLSETVSGGTWNSGNTSKAIVSSTGSVGGVSTGNVSIYYQVSNSCGVATSSYTLLVGPFTGAITGPTYVTTGGSATLNDTVTGGKWSSSNTSVATVDSISGVISGIALGSTTISYSVNTTCGMAVTMRPFSVGYCVPSHDSAALSCSLGEGIGFFILEGEAGTIIDDFNSCNGTTNYEDNTASSLSSMSAVFRQNATYVGAISTTPDEGAYDDGQVYIDFNNDEIFESSESVGTISHFGNELVEYYITIPLMVDTGVHRMRVVASYGGGAFGGGSLPNLDPCAVSLYGDVRDYLVNIEAYPYFSGGADQNMKTCTGVSSNLDSILRVFNIFTGHTERWRINTPPYHGILSGFTTTATSNGDSVMPTGLTYTPFAGYVGTDEFSIKISDGAKTALTTIHTTVGIDPIIGGTIIDTGTSRRLTDATPGGVWTSSDTTIASVSDSGIVTGIARGAVTIFYTVPDSVCGYVTSATEIAVTNVPCTPSFINAPASCADGYTITYFGINGEYGTYGPTSISDSRACNGDDDYENNTDFQVLLNQNTTYPVSISGKISESFQVWIDFNDDNVFQTSETVGGGALSDYITFHNIDSITIPPGAAAGTHRMRVVVNNPFSPVHDSTGLTYPNLSPCSSGVYYGDGRDYSVVIGNFNHPIHYTKTYDATQFDIICAGASPINIDSLLTIKDLDVSQTITWTVIDTGHGTFAGFGSTGTTNGNVVIPYGLTYQPDSGFTGYDIFTVQVSDGYSTDMITIGVHVGNPDPGFIYAAWYTLAPNMVYTGQTGITLADATPYHLKGFAEHYSFAGGTWKSSDTTIVTIDSVGHVTGIAPGTAIVTYTLTNSCGTSYTTYPVTDINIDTTIYGSSPTPPNPPPGYGSGGGGDGGSGPSGGGSITYTTYCNAPYFKNGLYQHLFMCRGTSKNIDSLMIIRDADTGQAEIWSVLTPPSHGTLSGFNDTIISNGGYVLPSGLVYTPDAGFTGHDFFNIQIDDTTCATSWTHVSVLVGPYAGEITGPSWFSMGSDSILHDGEPDGYWLSSNNDVASIGFVNGILDIKQPGYTTISYTVTDACGTAIDTFPVLVGNDNLYLQGRYVELGIAPNGAFGSTLNAPAGYHISSPPSLAFWDPEACYSDTSDGKLGMVYDYGHNGWTTDTPGFYGDYVLPGVPLEGWSMQVSGVASNAFTQNYQYLCSGYHGYVHGSNDSLTDSAGVITASWNGDFDSGINHLNLTQITTLDTNASWVKVSTKVINTTTHAIGPVYFNRMINPKNDAILTDSFKTNNQVNSRSTSYNYSSRVMVSSNGTVYTNSYLGLATRDSRAVAYITDTGVITDTHLDSIWNHTESYHYSGSSRAEAAMGIVYNLGTLAPGDSAILNYAYIFNDTTGIDSVFPGSLLVVGGSSFDTTGTINVCGTVTSPYDSVYITHSCGKKWSWMPATGLNATTGCSNVINLDALSGTTTYTITGTDIATGDTAKRIFLLTINRPATYNVISGPSSVCQAANITLSDSTGYGSWSGTNPGIATINSLGIVTGVAGGTDSIIYTITNVCGSISDTVTITVNPLPAAPGSISGPASICVGSEITISDTTVSGTWSSSAPGIASINDSGLLTGIADGSATITYSVSNSCGSASVSTDITVNPNPVAGTISGASNVCMGSSIHLTDTISGGTWSSSDMSGATVSSSGNVTGVRPGYVTISYSVASSCGTAVATDTILVNSNPDPRSISGTSAVCAGNATVFSISGTSGTWRSSNTSVATVNDSGVVFGVRSGTATISYTYSLTCVTRTATREITVNPAPVAGFISGPDSVCVGSSITLVDTATGGYWSLYEPATSGFSTGIIDEISGSVDSATGVVTGVNAGTATIYYIVSNGCGTVYDSANITVNPLPNAGSISGSATICNIGTSVTLADTASGGTWSVSSASAGIATVNSSGVVTSLGAGSATISYNVTNSCGSAAATTSENVVIAPSTPSSISGSTSVCSGSTLTLTDATTGGSWVSANTSIATMGSSGVLTGITSGNVVISYVLSNICGTAVALDSITVIPTPRAGTISGTTAFCTGSTTVLTDSFSSGTWYSGSPSIATIGSSGTVYGVSAGTILIYYFIVNSCGYAVHDVSITVSSPAVASITGASPICAGSSETLGESTTGGTWSSSDTTIASVNSSGLAEGVSAGTAMITYTVTNSCGTHFSTTSVTINSGSIDDISGATTLCRGSSITLSDASAGGIWSSANPSVATISSTGTVSGLSVGIAVIGYFISNSCGSFWKYTTVTVSDVPAVSSIVGTTVLCPGTSSTLSDSVSGGTWSSDAAGIASVSSEGLVTGLYAGSANVIYTITNSCGTTSISSSINVNPLPVAGSISGPSAVCVGNHITLTDTATGGTWSSSSPGTASVNSSGWITGIATGSVNISYSVSNSCGSATSISTINVNGVPATPASISGSSALCIGSMATFTDTTSGGTWHSSAPGIASINTVGTVSAISSGIATISYSYTNSCGSRFAITTVRVDSTPVTPDSITGVDHVCIGTPTYLSDVTSGGTWSTSDASIMSVNTYGLIIGVSTGAVNITYTVTNSCGSAYTTKLMNSLTYPSAGTITGPTTICAGSTVTLTDTSGMGAWESLNTSIATVSSAGVVTALSAGYDDIGYSVTNVCGSGVTNFEILVVTPSTGSISGGSATLCPGSTTSLTAWSGSGTWSSVNSAVATVSSGGVVIAVAPGNDTIAYSVTNACGTYRAVKAISVTSPTVPATITGTSSAVCAGSVITFADSTSGGVWSSTNPSVATLSSSGIISVLSAGIDTIKYIVTNGCGQTGVAKKVLTVISNSLDVISGPSTVCVGSAITLNELTTGGTWTRSSTTIASLSSTGVVTGLAAGSVTITYTLSGTCGTSYTTYAVTVVSPGTISAISGSATVCPGSTITLSDATTGSSFNWSSSNAAKASVNASTGVVTGIAPGTDTIKYTVTNSCGTYSTTKSISVTGATVPGGIAGSSGAICPGATETFTDGTTGGVWSSSNSSIATVSATGVITGIANGLDTILYSITNACGEVGMAMKTVNVNPGSVNAITGPNNLCTGTSITLTETTTSGTWSSSSTTIATVSSAGVVHGIAGGTTTIKYTVTSSCGTVSASYFITVSTPGVVAPITGGSSALCIGATMALADATIGSSYVWTSTNTAKATVDSVSGIVTGVFGGADTIKYTVTNACGTVTAIKAFSVTGPTVPGVISGATTLCQGATTNFSDGTPGGVWTSSNLSIATVSATGVVTGVGSGLDTVTYTITNTCGEVGNVSKTITINPLPNAGIITGNTSVIVGHSDTLDHSVSGGTWSSVSTGIATINSSGIVHGVAMGTDTIKYSVTNSCGTAVARHVVTVTASRSEIGPGENSGTATAGENGKIVLFPNPATSSLNIEWSGEATGTARIVITDMLGKEIYNDSWELAAAIGKTAIDVSSLKSGIYIISIKSETIRYTGRIVVEN